MRALRGRSPVKIARPTSTVGGGRRQSQRAATTATHCHWRHGLVRSVSIQVLLGHGGKRAGLRGGPVELRDGTAAALVVRELDVVLLTAEKRDRGRVVLRGRMI